MTNLTPTGLRVTWYGHAAFKLEGSGHRVILDPYRSPDSGGYEPIDDSADVVVVSHENDRYHSHLGQIRPPFTVLRGLEFPPDGVEFGGVRFHAQRVFESPARRPEEAVTILDFTLGGVRVLFLGDLGHPLEPDQLAGLRGCDLALVPAGGPPTLALEDLRDLLVELKPRHVVPMHYLTPRINLKLQPLDVFLSLVRPLGWPIRHANGPSLIVPAPETHATSSTPPEIHILTHLR